jgi:hypothetical protein
MILRVFYAAGGTFLALAAAVLLGACTPGMTAAVASLRQIMPGGATADADKLDPGFAYLRVTRGRHVGLLWRGSVERAPEGPVEVYYSGTGEVLRLRDGRLVGLLGLATEWRQVVDRAPPWSAVLAAHEPIAFGRNRDVMPGYRSGVRDELVLRRISPPDQSALRALDARSLTWFEERVRSRGFTLPGVPSDTLPAARYALDVSGPRPAVVYAEQCVASDLCFTWQRWSTAVQQAAARDR